MPRATIRPARRLAFRIAAAVMLVQAAVFATTGAVYLVWFESKLVHMAETMVLGPGRLIQSNQLSYAAISDRTKMQEIVGVGLVDAMLVGANGNVFHAMDPAMLGRQVSSIEGIDPAWFRGGDAAPLLTRYIGAGHAYLVGITPLITYENVAPFLYVYVKLDASAIDHEKEQMRIATVAAVLFAILMTTVVIYCVFEWLLFRRIRNAIRVLDHHNGHEIATERDAPRDEISLVETGVQKALAARELERSMRALAESALIEIQAKEAASASAAERAVADARRAQALVDAVPDGLVTIDARSKVLTCNDVAARCLGTPPYAILGRPLTDFLRPVDSSQVDPQDEDGTDAWPRIGTHRAFACVGREEIEIVVIRAQSPDGHRAIFLRQAIDDEVRAELDRLSDSIGHALKLTPGQWQSVGERLAMLRDYVGSLEAERRIVSSALDAVPMAVVVVDRNATIRYANMAGERVLDQKDGLLVLQGRLSAARSADNSQLRLRIESVLTEGDESGMSPWAAMRLERADGVAWFIRIAPLGLIARPASDSNVAIVLINDPKIPSKPSAAALRQLHGLTYAEAEILGRLTMGMRLQEIARELDISVETVRTHLKAIFTKTGTSRQAELVRHAILSGSALGEPDPDGKRAHPSSRAALRASFQNPPRLTSRQPAPALWKKGR